MLIPPALYEDVDRGGRTSKGDQTEVSVVYHGLVPQDDCFDVCSNAWGWLIRASLPSLITTGAGQPHK